MKFIDVQLIIRFISLRYLKARVSYNTSTFYNKEVKQFRARVSISTPLLGTNAPFPDLCTRGLLSCHNTARVEDSIVDSRVGTGIG